MLNLISKKSFKSALLAGTATAAALLGASGVATAQDSGTVEKVTVTGTRVKQKNLQTTSPVTQVGAATVDSSGVTRVEDLVNDLPQVFAAQNASVSNGSNGTATVDLRGLGAARTVVLINGRRMAYGTPASSAADINQIPAQLIDRIEVLTGGASAVYGSDALAGVVNFIMKSNFEGVSVDFNYGFFEHHNDYDGPGNLRNVIAGRALTNPSQFKLPQDDVNDGWGKEMTITMGASTGDGKGNVTGYFSYRNNDLVIQSQRDFTACALNAAPAVGGNWTCGGSGTSAGGQFFVPGPNLTLDSTTGLMRPFDANLDVYNFGPLNYFQRPDERYSGGVFARYQVDEQVELYGEFMFSDIESVAQIAPSGDFGNTSTINCGNPFLSAGSFTAAQLSNFGCTPAAIAANSIVNLTIARRNVEGGGRQDTRHYDSQRFVVGARGNVIEGWDYDISAQYQRVNLEQIYKNDFSVTRLQRALNVVDVAGTPTCQSVVDGTDPLCVPWNIFQLGGVTQAALDYLQIPLVRVGNSQQRVVTGTVTGDLGTLGIVSPWASTTPSLVVGGEFRRDELTDTPDTSFQTGDGAGQGGPTTPLAGSVDVTDVFMEIDLPIIENAPWAKSVKLDAAYRHSNYDTGITTDTHKIGAEWAPLESFKIRGSQQRAVRAANIIEMFSAQSVGLFNMGDDPCDKTLPLTYAGDAACIGVNPWQVTLAQATSGSLTNPATQYNTLGGGNPALAPETADTTTLGVVFTPSFIENLVVTVDYFNIEVADLVSTLPPDQIVELCYAGNLSMCNLITRSTSAGAGSLWLGNSQVQATNINIGGLETSGIDLNASYRFGLGDIGLDGAGDIRMDMVGTFLDKYITDNGVADPYDCAGLYGNPGCGTPNPEWRHRLSTTWYTPWDASVTAVWRHIGSVDRIASCTAVPGTCTLLTGRIDSVIDAYDYLDLSASVSLPLNANLRVGMNNVFDTDPPVVGSTTLGTGQANGNVPNSAYDQSGRWVFMGISVDL